MARRWVYPLVLTMALQVGAQEVRSLPPPTKRFAVVVGVDAYDDQQITPLIAAASDARKLRDTLKNCCGFPPDQIRVLATGELKTRQPTRENIMSAVAEVVEKVPVDGLFLFAFAGHGKEGTDREALLFPTNVRQNLLKDTAIPLSWIRDRIREKRIEQVILLLDTCRNDPGGRADVPNPLTQGFFESARFDMTNDGVIAYATLYASSLGERAWEDTDPRQGYFTAAVIEALGNASREVTLGQLIKHVEREVQIRVKEERGAQQHPYSVVEGYRADSLVLAHVAPTKIAVPSGIVASEEELDLDIWQRALVRNTAEAFEDYVRRHPNGRFVAQARKLIDAHASGAPFSAEAARKAYDAGEYEQARRLLQNGLAQSDPEALAELGKMSLLCLGGPCNFEDSAYFLHRAMKLGRREAEGWLALQWLVLGGHRARAIDYARASAARGELVGRVALATAYESGTGVPKDKATADEYYRLAGPELQERRKAGDPWALNILARMYVEGLGGLARNEALGIELIRAAAAKNYPTARRNLAVMYQMGFAGNPRDDRQAFDLLRAAAALGHPNSQYGLALAYLYGTGVQRDEQKAVELLRAAADQGLVVARTALGYLHETGRGGLQKSDASAAELYRQAADDGDAQAQYYLAMMYASGRGGLPEDEGRAAELYHQAAETHVGAQNALGAMYESGTGGLVRDDVKAVAYYRRAADADHPPALLNLGRMFHEGRGGLSHDPAKTEELYQRAADLGNATAQARLARMYLGDGVPVNDARAVELFRAAAGQGDASAMTTLAILHAEGRGGLPQDPAIAAQLYEKAASQGDAAAQNNLGIMYLNGAGGLPRDPAKALMLFQKAAAQNETPALTNLGVMYERGSGEVAQDYAKAVAFYSTAAEHGNIVATLNLAVMHENGRGVPKDLNRAVELYRKAAAGGNEAAKAALERLKQ